MNYSSPATANAMDEETASQRLGQSQRDIRANRQCLLVVDDDPSVVGLLSQALQEWGYEVIVAGNGWEALVLAGRQSVDGMLVDIDMPIMDGRTMLSELRGLGHRMPVLMMSGESDEPIFRQLLMEGAQGFFLKPPHLQSLQETCRQVFARYALEEYAASYFPAGSNKE
ncbi:MAG TPA: response regulator [Nitrospirales bacterium]|nr:response regulator [Nitrospirales bacterium]